MDGIVLGFFLLAAFLGAVTTGVAGFAMGLVVSGIWLHILTPVQTVTLMVSYSVLLQGYGVLKLRHALTWRKVAPFIVGSVIGVPIGAMLLAHINPAHLRTGVGLVLLLYSIYYLARPVIKPVQGGLPADLIIGFLNGVLGGRFIYLYERRLCNLRVLQSCSPPRRPVSQIKFFPRLRRSHVRLLNCA